ncbi:hypothetical protein AXK11_02585 [Cephaloticoccus primus]|uniref:Uncharacterized protein n=2 Tax=Cephaloticoccus primus TaxID=1548207 RepID=A0A139SS11_9BACT|nr:hypothetical protein AXK11_02585 [Cephaloticoccus primus]
MRPSLALQIINAYSFQNYAMKSFILVGLFSLFFMGCTVTPTPRADSLSVLSDSQLIDTEFALKKGYWVYSYEKPIVIFRESGREVWYRMTAATGGTIGGRRLNDYGRYYWGTLYSGTRIRLVGVTRYKDGAAYIAEVVNPEDSRLEKALIEIYDRLDNYSPEDYPSGVPKLNEAFFRPLRENEGL